MPRFVPKNARSRMKRSVYLTNIALAVVIAGMCLLVGPFAFFIIEGPIVLLAGMAGVWLFYVQHQFEDVYWESSDQWSYADAALRGSSYLKLPKVLQWFSGNIGLHHVHHLSAKVPNYRLQARSRQQRDLPRRSRADVLGVAALHALQGDRRRHRPPADLARGPCAQRRPARAGLRLTPGVRRSPIRVGCRGL